MLLGVVESGTATRADLATYLLGGKSGTARRTVEGKGYVPGNYTASFVGLFPADRPQYVVLVKIDSPPHAYYGGEIAAPVTKVVLRAALAARDAALNRAELATVERVRRPADTALPAINEAPEMLPLPGNKHRPRSSRARARRSPLDFRLRLVREQSTRPSGRCRTFRD